MNISFYLHCSETTDGFIPQNTPFTLPISTHENEHAFNVEFICNGKEINGTCLGSNDLHGRVNTIKRLIEDKLNGYWLIKDIVSFIRCVKFIYDNKTYVTSGPSRPLTEFRLAGNPLLIDENFVNIIGTEAGWHLSNSLRSYKTALLDAYDGPMHIYRSIEILRQYYRKKLDPSIPLKKQDDKSWELLREKLNVTKELIQKYANIMTPIRHGDFTKSVTKDEYRLMLSIGHEIINKFISAELLNT